MFLFGDFAGYAGKDKEGGACEKKYDNYTGWKQENNDKIQEEKGKI